MTRPEGAGFSLSAPPKAHTARRVAKQVSRRETGKCALPINRVGDICTLIYYNAIIIININQTTMSKKADRLRRLEERRDAINAQLQKERAKEQKEKRKKETRKKILAGAMILDKVANGAWEKEKFKNHMDRFLTKESDRALFDLLPLDPGESSSGGH